MSQVVEMQIWQFALIYVLLLLIAGIMKLAKIDQVKTLVVSSARMTVQLVLAGLVLSYVFKKPHPAFIITYIAVMMGFAIHRVLRQNQGLNRDFQLVIALSIVVSGLFVLAFFIVIVVGESLFNPQYVIPIAGMLLGNTMTGISLGVKNFRQSLSGQRARIRALTCFGVDPDSILLPFMRQALESAMLPTINSMAGMGIVALPGMMTGQILSGTMPTTAILYQIAIMIAIAAVVTLASFGSLYFGYRTLVNRQDQTDVLPANGKTKA